MKSGVAAGCRVPGKPNLLLGAYDIASLGYTADEFFVSGAACSYAPDGEFGSDGRWDAVPSGVADYVTRIVVLRPTDDARFNGTVLVEWLIVSGGIDAPAVWFLAHREVVREGHAYVAVSAQQVGVDGGARLGGNMSLKTLDPERYSRLSHPGDAFSYDIFSQVGQVVREGAGNGVLGPLSPEFVVAVGESLSAMFLTTYVNAVDPLVKVYDGFLVHSRFGPAAPLDGMSIFAASESGVPEAVKFRPDLRVPLLTVITETDLVGAARAGYYLARQPDNEWLRTWEIPGTAHADNYHDPGCPDRHRFRTAGSDRGRLRSDQHPDGSEVVVFHQFRPAAPLCPPSGDRRPARLGPHRRDCARRATRGVERRRSTSADPGCERDRDGRCPYSLGRRADCPDILHRRRGECPVRSLRYR